MIQDININQLIERLRGASSAGVLSVRFEAADALERLTQPVGVDAIGWITEDGRHTLDPNAPVKFGKHWRIPIYSAETIARLQADIAELKEHHFQQMQRGLEANTQLQAERDELVKALRLAITTPHMGQDRYTLLVQDAAIAALAKIEGSKL